jgi:hypothetical protein
MTIDLICAFYSPSIIGIDPIDAFLPSVFTYGHGAHESSESILGDIFRRRTLL